MKRNLILLAVVMLAALPVAAVESAFWQVGSYEEFLQGTLRDISLNREGRLRLAPESRTVFSPDETLALSLIQEMKSQANYLSSDFTLRHFRKELASFSLVNRHRLSAWEKRGGKSLEEAAQEQVEKILQKPKAGATDQGALEKVRSIEKKWLEKIRK